MSISTGPAGRQRGLGPLAGLKRLLEQRPRQEAAARCEMCAERLPEQHAHVVNTENRQLLCTCRACYLLFTPEGAAQGKYRAVPERFLYTASFQLSDAQWDAIQIPVGMAFFFINSSLGRVVAFYPSPAGATESLLPPATWEAAMQANPLFATLAPDVEALLLYRRDTSFECYLAPIDACYELVGRVRLHWKGFDGGAAVWREIDDFFGRLREKSRALETQG